MLREYNPKHPYVTSSRISQYILKKILSDGIWRVYAQYLLWVPAVPHPRNKKIKTAAVGHLHMWTETGAKKGLRAEYVIILSYSIKQCKFITLSRKNP